MKSNHFLVITGILLIFSFSQADQTILVCDTPISDIYSITIMQSPTAYYARVETTGSRKLDVPVKATDVAKKSYNLTLKDSTKVKLSYTDSSGWFVTASSPGWSESGLADCR